MDFLISGVGVFLTRVKFLELSAFANVADRDWLKVYLLCRFLFFFLEYIST